MNTASESQIPVTSEKCASLHVISHPDAEIDSVSSISHKLFSPLETALDLSHKGYFVHPLAPRNKIPIAARGYNDATRDENTIRQWWKDTPDANVGICLHKSGLVDIAPDCKEWAERFKANGMPRTTLYTSGNGWHAWYRLPKGGPIARVCVKGQYDIMSEGNAVAPGSIHPNGSTYTLLTDLRAVEDLPLAPEWAIDILRPHVKAARKEHAPEDWASLPSGGRLASARFRGWHKTDKQMHAIVSGEGITINGDSSRSVQRAGFVTSLIRAKYPHDEIRALALHFRGVLESNPKWFEADIDRLIAKYTPADYKPEPTRGIDRFEEPPRGGRHYEITDAEFLDGCQLLADCGPNGIILDWTRGELAEHYHVSYGTIQRIERRLTESGALRRIVSDDRQRSYLLLSPATWNVRSQCITEPNKETANEYAGIPVRDICQVAYSGQLPAQRDTSLGAALSAEDSARIDRPGLPSRDRYIDAEAYTAPLRASDDRAVDVRSQFVLAHSDAPNTLENAVCMKERAHVEITHPSAAAAPTVLSVGTPDARGMQLVRYSDGSARWNRAELQENVSFSAIPGNDAPQQSAPIDPMGQNEPEASYVRPIVEPSGPYTGRPKQYMSHAERWRLSNEAIRMRNEPAQVAEQHSLEIEAAPVGQRECVLSAPVGRAARQYAFIASAATLRSSPKIERARR